MGYKTVAGNVQHEVVVMGSRFIASVAPIRDADEFEVMLSSARTHHPDASHHCWAYRVASEQRFNDDGEPGGTAGRPMIEVLTKRELDHVGAVVVRYFGGRKLGAGGLARAYGGSVASAVRLAGEVWVPDRVQLRVQAPFAQVDNVLRTLPPEAKPETRFDEHGVQVDVDIIADDRHRLERALNEATRGEVTVCLLDGAPGRR